LPRDVALIPGVEANPFQETAMLKFLANWFADPTTPKAAPKARLALEGLEDRAVPTPITNPGVLYAFDPRPELPGYVRISQVETHGIIIVGGRVGAVSDPLAAHDPVEPTDFIGVAGATSLASRALVTIGG
jgi:hypothetical protein